MGWLIITYRVPAGGSTARVAVWREVRRAGALLLQQSIVAFPDDETFRAAVERFRLLVSDLGGETLALHAQPFDSADATKLVDAWNEARAAEYTELTSECGKFLAEIDHEFAIGKFTLAELDEEEAEFDKLERWHERISARDIHAAAGGEAAGVALTEARAALERYSSAVYDRTKP